VQDVNAMCDTIFRDAESVNSEMLLHSTCPETEYRLDMCPVTNGDHIEIFWAHTGLSGTVFENVPIATIHFMIEDT